MYLDTYIDNFYLKGEYGYKKRKGRSMTYLYGQGDIVDMSKTQQKPVKRPPSKRQILNNERTQIASYEWSSEEKELIDWYMGQKEFPRFPFELRKGIRVVDFFTSLREEIQRGPNQYRARHGLIRQDLADLRRIMEGMRDVSGNV